MTCKRFVSGLYAFGKRPPLAWRMSGYLNTPATYGREGSEPDDPAIVTVGSEAAAPRSIRPTPRVAGLAAGPSLYRTRWLGGPTLGGKAAGGIKQHRDAWT